VFHPYLATPSAESVGENEILSRIARQLTGEAADAADAFDVLAKGAVALVGAEGAVVARLDRDHFRVEAAAGSLVPMVGFDALIAGSLGGESLARLNPVVLNDAAGDPRVDAHFMAAFSPRQVAIAPIVLASGPHGFILVLNSTARSCFTPTDGALLQRLADHAALVIWYSDMMARAVATAHQTEKLAALGEMVAGVAHELNNPLTGISTFAQLLLTEPLGEDQLESVRTIKRESDRAVGVIRDLLTFARKGGPRYVPVDLVDIVQQTLRLRAYALQSAGVVVETDLAPDLPTIPGDDQKLQQVVLNLMINAEYAMLRSVTRRLTVRLERRRVGDIDGVLLEVADTGAGIPAEVTKHIFEPFFTTKPVGVGTGLGLSVSYGIVRAHGGTIAVESTPGIGTIFRVALPITDMRRVPVLSPTALQSA
jgi:signal transduction histidine kinase